jgi:hypothetical protein
VLKIENNGLEANQHLGTVLRGGLETRTLLLNKASGPPRA